jgi:sortase A
MNKTIKATIIDLIVALFIVAIILIVLYLVCGQAIDNTIQLVNQVAIKVDKTSEIKQTEINEETNKLINYPEYGTQYATIEIPKIDVNLPVYFGDTLEILKKGVGHSSGSYFPGEGGSIIYMGHNSKNVFRRFSELQKGNEIKVTTNYGEYTYKIYDMQLIKETEVEKLPIQKEKEILMVYTCYPFNNIGYATQRYVVYAELEN